MRTLMRYERWVGLGLSLMVGLTGCLANAVQDALEAGNIRCETISDCPGGYVCRLVENGLRCVLDTGAGDVQEDTRVCEGTLCSGSCIDTQTNAAHCGACGVACGAGEVCEGGACVCGGASGTAGTGAVCGAGQSCCGSPAACVSSDDASCICGGSTCESGERCCNDTCTAVQSSAAHCGVCGNPCGSGEVCQSGSCSTDCGGLTECGGSCVNIQASTSHCGACDSACSGGNSGLKTVAVCVRGSCDVGCEAGYGDCDGNAENGCETLYGCGQTQRVSVSSAGAQADAASVAPDVSADGRYVVFQSSASNLVAGDTNGSSDIFLRDRQTETTQRISVSSSGEEGNDRSTSPAISSDGRYVAFVSNASNLVAGDKNSVSDIFVRDRQAGTTLRVSVSSEGQEAGNASMEPDLAVTSAGVVLVVFESTASNLVAGDTNAKTDIFLHTLETGATQRLSVTDGGEQGDGDSRAPAIDAGGLRVVFESDATQLISGDTNGFSDVFVKDLNSGTVTRAGVSGTQGDSFSREAAISGDGESVGFKSEATNWVSGDSNFAADIFVSDPTGTTLEWVTDGASGASRLPSLSGDSASLRVAFESSASNLVQTDTNGVADVFVWESGVAMKRASVDAQGNEGTGASTAPAISHDGRWVVFASEASNLVDGDTNSQTDIFVHALP